MADLDVRRFLVGIYMICLKVFDRTTFGTALVFEPFGPPRRLVFTMIFIVAFTGVKGHQ
jgi:hypothetical protein